MNISKKIRGLEIRTEQDTKILFYDIDKLPEEDLLVIDLDDDDFSGLSYQKRLQALIKVCSRGGTKYNGKEVTFVDDEHPVCVVRFRGTYHDDDVSTYFLILKEDIYNSGYCYENNYLLGKNWKIVFDSRVEVIGSERSDINISYSIISDKSKSYLIDSVGKNVMLSGLWYLKFGIGSEKVKGYHAICHNLCEAARLTDVAQLVCSSIDIGHDLSLGALSARFQKWNTFSTIHRNRVLNTREQSYFEVSLEKLRLVGINNFDELERSLNIMLREKELDRDKRRNLVLKSSRRSMQFYKRGLDMFRCLKKKSPCWKTEWNRVELEAARAVELHRLIGSGGNPDIWNCLNDALRESNLRYSIYKVKNTDVNIKRVDLSESVDDNGHDYIFDQDFMLCDPIQLRT